MMEHWQEMMNEAKERFKKLSDRILELDTQVLLLLLPLLPLLLLMLLLQPAWYHHFCSRSPPLPCALAFPNF